jgi:hypothetical protein
LELDFILTHFSSGMEPIRQFGSVATCGELAKSITVGCSHLTPTTAHAIIFLFPPVGVTPGWRLRYSAAAPVTAEVTVEIVVPARPSRSGG